VRPDYISSSPAPAEFVRGSERPLLETIGEAGS
jgi:hypothetical protein